MDYRSFREELARLVSMELGKDTRIHFEQIQKNNGVTADGMVFSGRNSSVSPVFYVKDYYRLWNKGVPMEQLVKKVIWNYERCRQGGQPDPGILDDYEAVKDQIFFQLIHYEKNKKRLEDVPYRRILDLAMVFYCRLEYEGERAAMLIRSQNLTRWGITAGHLEEYAREVTPKKLPARLFPISELLGLPESEENGLPMYVITNSERNLGAGAILYPKFLKNHTEALGEEFFILPSSIHECILVPGEMGYRQETLAAIVQEVNRDHVDPKEVLSDQVYRYRKDSDGIFL